MPLFLCCHYSATATSEDATQFNSSAPELISRQAGVSKLDSPLHFCSVEFSFITTLYGFHGKRRLILFRIVLGVFIAQLHSSSRETGHTKTASLLLRCVYRGHVLTESLPSNGYARYSNNNL
jgi:hypothetical protein